MKYAPEMYGCPENELEGKQLEFLARSGKRIAPFVSPEQPIPRFEHGRWLCDCPCGSGAGITQKGIAHCFECGRIMRVGSWPNAEKRARVKQALRDAKESEKNWRVDEPEPVRDVRGNPQDR